MGKVTELDVMLSRKIGEIADAYEVIALNVPPIFYAISRFYKNFNQTPDEEVFEALSKGMKKAMEQS